MTIEVISQLAVAGGTIGLAVAAFVSIRSSGKTLRQVSEQLRYQRSQLVPYVSASEFRIEGDRVRVTLKNPTRAVALWVGLRADFFVVEMARYATQDSHARRLTEQEEREIALGGRQMSGRYVLSRHWLKRKLMHKGLELERTGVVAFAQSGLDGGVLIPGSEAEVDFAPRFGAQTTAHHLYTFDFAELRALLGSNGVVDIAISLSLVYKDSAEENIGDCTLANFASSLDEANSLEAMFAAGHRVDFIPLGWPEIAGPGVFFDIERYESLRSHWNRSATD